MINEVQTLLINRNPQDKCFDAYAGDYSPVQTTWLDSRLYAPADFSPRSTSDAAVVARAHLFGSAPDYYYLLYRMSQVADLLFCGKYDEHVAVFDPRHTGYGRSLTTSSPFMRTAFSSSELGRFSGDAPVDDIVGRSLFSARFNLGSSAYQVIESSRPLTSAATPFGQSLPGEKWWIDKVPSADAIGELTVSQIHKPQKTLRAVWLGIQAIEPELIHLLTNIPTARRDAVVLLLAQDRPWYDRLAGWLFLLAESSK